jgi:GDPmannose 4,6-dehydratase
MTRALVVGSEGQDGRLLFDLLAREGAAVLGLGKGSARSTEGDWNSAVDITCRLEVEHLVKHLGPDEVYYIAAVHQASEDAAPPDDIELFERSHAVHVAGLLHFLEAMSEREGGALFYAASSLIFGLPAESPQDESTPFRPRDIYGITKTTGAQVCRYYRDTRAVNVSVGILFNHESPLRSHNFVSQKIVRGVVAIAGGAPGKLTLGNLSAAIDWGYAPDYVRAMTLIVRNPTPDDYVIATGETHSVREFAEIAFRRLGLDWRDHVVEDRSVLTRQSAVRVGNASRLRDRTGWRPSVSFPEMVELLVDAAAKEHAG